MDFWKLVVELSAALLRSVVAMLVVGVVLTVVFVAAVVLGPTYYYPKVTCIMLVISAIATLFGLARASAQGNVYCPACASEDHRPVIHHNKGATTHRKITRICKTCGKKW